MRAIPRITQRKLVLWLKLIMGDSRINDTLSEFRGIRFKLKFPKFKIYW